MIDFGCYSTVDLKEIHLTSNQEGQEGKLYIKTEPKSLQVSRNCRTLLLALAHKFCPPNMAQISPRRNPPCPSLAEAFETFFFFINLVLGRSLDMAPPPTFGMIIS